MKNVKIYSTNSCSFCIRAKQYFDENNIEYENIDIASDPQAGQEMVKVSGQMGVPVIVIDGEVIVGFDKGKIDSLLGL